MIDHQPQSADVEAPEPIDLREMLARGVHIYWRHAPAIIAVVATVSVPASVVRAVAQGHRPAEVAAGALQAFAYLVSIGLVIQIVVAALAHEPVTVRGAFAALRPRAGRLAVTSLMVGAVVLLGTFTLLLPGVLFYTWFAFAVPIAVLEDHRVMHSMAISRDTVRGSWWRVFGILLLALVIESISSGVVQNACSPVTDTSVGANVVVTTLAGLVLTPVFGLIGALLYLDERIRRPLRAEATP